MTSLYRVLRETVRLAPSAQWDVIRHKLRFVGITVRHPQSPRAWRWQQHAPWTAELPAPAVTNISIEERVWDHLAGRQRKLTPAFEWRRWSDQSVMRPGRKKETRQALAQAVAIFEQGRSREIRGRLIRQMQQEPAFQERWLRALVSVIGAAS